MRRITVPVLGTAFVAAVTGCASSSKSGSSGPAIEAKDDSCTVSTATLPSGTHTFSVTNKGSKVTEAEVLGQGERVLGEVENVGPGLKRTFIVQLKAGDYTVACKPGQVGNGIRQALSVTGGAAAATVAPDLSAAVATYRTYVEDQVTALVAETKPFTDAVRAGDIAKAKSLYPAPRLRYERIEPIAESFGDLDPKIDARIDDVKDPSTWTGFHRLEHDLWKDGDISQDGPVATQLDTDVTALLKNVKTSEIQPTDLGNGAKDLMDEVATSKVTGEEERYSRLDLLDFQGNVEGAQEVVTALTPVLQRTDPTLLATLTTRFAAVLDALKPYGSGTTFVSYDTLTKAQVKDLATLVDALSEPLSQITATSLKG